MTETLLIDTDVIIDYLRGQKDAVAYIEGLIEKPLLSAITIAELYGGVREGDERNALNAFIKAFDIVDVDEAIATKGGLFRRDYGKSHGVGLADAMIAASAYSRNATVVTLNKKHFPMTEITVIVPYQKA